MEKLKQRFNKLVGKSANTENDPSLSPPRFISTRAARLSRCERPVPLGERNRPLTPPSAPGVFFHQEQSLFFSELPIDIRRMIYDYVLSSDDRVLHIASSWRRLFSRRCHETNLNTDPRGWLHICWRSMGVQAEDGTTVDWSEDGSKPPRPSFFGLLRCCRRIYTESIDILYSENVLDFRQTRTIVDFKATIPTNRLSAIRSLQLDCPLETEWMNGPPRLWSSERIWPIDIPYFWNEAWEAIAQMNGLKSLRVVLSHTDLWRYEPDHRCLVTLFRPMMSVRLPLYKVEFLWPVELDSVLKEVGGVPFSIEIK